MMNYYTVSLVFLVRKNMDVNEQCFYCCSTFHSHSRVFNNEQNSYPKMSVKQPLLLMSPLTYADKLGIFVFVMLFVVY